jgi:hypothetical protein
MKTNKIMIAMAIVCVAFLIMLPWAAMAFSAHSRDLPDQALAARARGKPIKEDKPGGGGGGKPPKDDPNPDPDPTSGKYAVVIGISNYDGYAYDLQYCDDDARDWAGYLNGKGYTVHTLIDSQASYNNILSEVSWLVGQENAGDDVAFIYSGHGIKQGKDSNIVTKELSYLSSSTLKSAFSGLDSTHAFFSFDACEIGGMSKLGGTGRYVAMGSSTSTNSYDGTKAMSNGVFTYYQLQALEDLGYTSAEESFAYAEERSEATYPMNCVSSDGYQGLMVF